MWNSAPTPPTRRRISRMTTTGRWCLRRPRPVLSPTLLIFTATRRTPLFWSTTTITIRRSTSTTWIEWQWCRWASSRWNFSDCDSLRHATGPCGISCSCSKCERQFYTLFSTRLLFRERMYLVLMTEKCSLAKPQYVNRGNAFKVRTRNSATLNCTASLSTNVCFCIYYTIVEIYLVKDG